MSDDAIFPDFSREFEALAEDPQPIVLKMSKVEAWILLSYLQLALRHLRTEGPTAKTARQIARLLEQACTKDRPALTEVARRGWDRRHDR
jgi:hypothetical protein